MAQSAKDRVAVAAAEVPRIDPREARRMQKEEGAVILDVRDGDEVARTGKAEGAVHVSRGMLEFRADPEAEGSHPELRPDRTVILYCAAGGRAALAGQTLRQMGYGDVRNMGGLKDWAEADLRVARSEG